jgi:hypothetical protein
MSDNASDHYVFTDRYLEQNGGIHIHDYNPGAVAPADGMTREQAEKLYEFTGFALGMVVVRRRSDNQRGTLEFTHNPRVYYGFQEA